MHRIFRSSFWFIGAAFALFPRSLLAVTYTFDNLSTGTLAGQDNWMTLDSNNTSDLVTIGTGFDTTKVARNPGTTGPAGSADVHINDRQNNANFSFGNLSGFSTVTMSFDTQVQNNASEDQYIQFSLGMTTNANYGSPAIAYRQSFGGTPIWRLLSGGYTGGPAGTQASGNLPGGINQNDWIRLTLIMNMTANGGTGSGDYYVTDLTQGGVPQLLTSNYNLNLDPSPTPTINVGNWDTMSTRSDFASSVVLDNLTVTPSPEPGTVALAIPGLALLFARRNRSRRSIG